MDKKTENIVTKVLQMAQNLAQMTKNWNCTEFSLSWYLNYFKHTDYEYEQRFWKFCHQNAQNGKQSGTHCGTDDKKWKLREIISKLAQSLF